MLRSPPLDRRAALVLGVAAGSLALPAAAAEDSDSLRSWYEAYLAAFNARDYPGFAAYYAEDVRFHGQAATLVGRDAVVAFYRNVHQRLDETVELLTFVGDAAHIAVEIRTTLVAREDWPDFPTGALKAGDRRGSIGFVFYDLAGRSFTRIRSARYARL